MLTIARLALVAFVIAVALVKPASAALVPTYDGPDFSPPIASGLDHNAPGDALLRRNRGG